MSQPARRHARHLLMFALAYGAIAAAVLFARPFDAAQAVDLAATAQQHGAR